MSRRKNVPSNDPQYGWNGPDPGGRSPEGGYDYYVTVVFSDGIEQQYKGNVILIR